MKQYASVIALVSLIAFVAGGAAPSMFAQAPTITSLKVDVYKVSAPTVSVATVTIPIAQPTCNLTPAPVVAVTVNPSNVEYTDPVNAGRVCRADVAALVNGLPPEDYISKAAFLYSDATVGGTSLASNPFTRFASSIPLGLRFVR